MDRIHNKGLINAHHVPGVLSWQQLQHACLNEMHTFYRAKIARTDRKRLNCGKNSKELS